MNEELYRELVAARGFHHKPSDWEDVGLPLPSLEGVPTYQADALGINHKPMATFRVIPPEPIFLVERDGALYLVSRAGTYARNFRYVGPAPVKKEFRVKDTIHYVFLPPPHPSVGKHTWRIATEEDDGAGGTIVAVTQLAIDHYKLSCVDYYGLHMICEMEITQPLERALATFGALLDEDSRQEHASIKRRDREAEKLLIAEVQHRLEGGVGLTGHQRFLLNEFLSDK